MSVSPPIAEAYVTRLPRRVALAGLDLMRAAVVVVLPFVTTVRQIYVLIFLRGNTRGRCPCRGWLMTWKTC